MSSRMAADEINEADWEEAEEAVDILDGEIELPDPSRDRSAETLRDLLSGGLGNDTLFAGADDAEMGRKRLGRDAA